MIALAAALLVGSPALAAPSVGDGTFAEMSAAYRSQLKAKSDPDDLRRGGDELAGDQLEREGETLTEAQAAVLERRLARNPGDVAARARLLGFYGRDPFRDDGRARRKPHTLWLIRALPESALTATPLAQPDYAWRSQARRAWEPVVSSSAASAEALGTAAGSLAPWYDDEAVGWLKRAAALQPRRARWRDMLGAIYDRRAQWRDRRWAGAALAELDAAQRLGESSTGDRRADMARLAFQAGQFARADAEARALLADAMSVDDFQRAGSIYEAEQVLARLSLRGGDLDAARRHMILSCAGARDSNVFMVNPEPSVAQELERRGRAGALAAFERACARFPSWRARAADSTDAAAD